MKSQALSPPQRLTRRISDISCLLRWFGFGSRLGSSVRASYVRFALRSGGKSGHANIEALGPEGDIAASLDESENQERPH
jgi:hypothetical protein